MGLDWGLNNDLQKNIWYTKVSCEVLMKQYN